MAELTPHRHNDFQVLHEFAKAARENLDQNIWDYIFGGAETEATVKRNRAALEKWAFRPRVLRDVTGVDAGTECFGERLRLPVCLAPIGSLQDITPGGGASAAQGAGAFGCAHMLSSVCQPGMEEVADQAPDAFRIFQLYVRGDGDWVDDHVRRAMDLGYKAFALTVDLDAYSRRERDLSKRYKATGRIGATGEVHQVTFSWKDIERIKSFCTVPLIVKGIATAEDTDLAIQHGVDAVYVSNHGGRQLDWGRGGLDVLPECVEAANGKAQVWFDGGILRGTDIVKAMALGADMVGIGRLQALALAADGAAGVTRMLELLETEVEIALALLGVTSYAALNATYLHPDAPPGPSHVFSGFPLLDEGY